MEPTRQQLAGMKNIGDIANWVGLQVYNPAREAFLTAIGLTNESHWRDLARIPEASLQTAIAALQVADATPTLVVQGHMGAIGHVARLLGGLTESI